jgi:GMP synthase (glutamine-hydrolysing)
MTDKNQLHRDNILILDFGSQYTQLIARRVRDMGVFSEIKPYDYDPEAIKAMRPKGIILSGGPESVTEVGSPRAPSIVFELGIPVLGICYGMQTMVEQHGGKVGTMSYREFGPASVNVLEDHDLFAGVSQEVIDVWMSHGDSVVEMPPDFFVLASTKTCPIAAIAHRTKPWTGLQFHPEVSHTPEGEQLLQQFVKVICGCESLWVPERIIEESIETVRAKVGSDKVILALSGGVDSSVVAALLQKAIGAQLMCVFVDTGLLRLNEGDEVMRVMQAHLGVNIIRVNARDRYFTALKGVADPEAKRKIIGGLFIEIFEEEAAKLTDAKWLAQGTIYPDVVESAKTVQGKAHVIKSHHNVGGLPADMKLKLIEPIRDLFKDEVRRLGLALGLPYERVYCHPFPGPGLGVRVLGEVTPEAVSILQKADAIFMEELRLHGWYEKTAQAFAVYIPQKSVAVMGDARVYADVIALRAVESIDYMTATWARLPYDLLDKVSSRIVNEVKGISRVTYDISSKPPATIEWE